MFFFFCETAQILRHESVKKRAGDKDMMEVGKQIILKNGRDTPLSTLLPRVQTISLGTGGFSSTNFGVDEGQYVEVSNKNPNFTVCLLNFIH